MFPVPFCKDMIRNLTFGCMNQAEFQDEIFNYQSGLEQYNTYFNGFGLKENLPFADFKDWFRHKAEWFYDGNELTLAEYQAKGGKYIGGNCYGNSVSIFLADAEYKYFEGFVHVQSRPHEVIRHGFNVKDGVVKDFTYYDEAKIKPVFYCGVEIPRAMLELGIDIHFQSIDEHLNRFDDYIHKRKQNSFLAPYFGHEKDIEHLVNIRNYYRPDFGN
jgi:hypothetical protein